MRLMIQGAHNNPSIPRDVGGCLQSEISTKSRYDGHKRCQQDEMLQSLCEHVDDDAACSRETLDSDCATTSPKLG